ncbi:hypothetical protein H696_02202 [Fonticula alba]|uniref:ERCC1-like central domain-containing protein n=1 Tax=Fonticula alba TaxID=691883 RepID=A0A058ZCT8_FONAL|nr:hypothetical protein H696_02202 [Fonticula alba]KCV71252.1 hypothetical protein H696_02202 [Fonticula alba]|eukprot:XP_009494375.1 hypothetical protein H696_02202 [Fonticula alba]
MPAPASSPSLSGSPATQAPPVDPAQLEPLVAYDGDSIIADPRQRGNPALIALERMRRMVLASRAAGTRRTRDPQDLPTDPPPAVEFLPLACGDFILGRTACAIFLCTSYHRQFPAYVYEQAKRLGGSFDLRLLLVLCDSPNDTDILTELTRLAVNYRLTILLAETPDEVARILVTTRRTTLAMAGTTTLPLHYLTGPSAGGDHAGQDDDDDDLDDDPDAEGTGPAQRHTRRDPHAPDIVGFLLTVRGINRTDAQRLRRTFPTVQALAAASVADLQAVPGIGREKATRVREAFREPLWLPDTSADAGVM